MTESVKVNPGDAGNAIDVALREHKGVYFPKYIGGMGDLTLDAWGTQKTSFPASLFHGMFTYDVPPKMWFIYEDGVQVNNSLSTGAASTDGALVIDSTGFSTVSVESRRHPRYQPNRGHLYSSSIFLPNKTRDGVRDFGLFTSDNGVFFRLKSDGNLYAVLLSGGVETHEELITIPNDFVGFDVENGNIYDIQFQWRGVGNYYFYIGNPYTGLPELVHTIELLGSITVLSSENPALPINFKCTTTTQGVVIKCGCCDVSSENGSKEREQYFSATGSQTVGTNYPVVSIFSPDTINSMPNTRDARLARISANADKKVTFTVWVTRDPTAFTGAAFAALNVGSYIETDTTSTTFDTAKASFVVSFNVEANSSEFINNPSKDTIDFFVVHGDYVVVTATGSAAAVSATIELGEEI